MALHTELPIHRTGVRLLDLMALANATHSHQDRALLGQLMRRRGLVVAGDMTKVFQPKGKS